MKLGCIDGCYNRSFDAGTMDLGRFLRHCVTDLRVQGAELQDIHFPETRPAYLDTLRRTAGDLGLALIGVGVHNDFGKADTTWRQSEVAKVKHWIEVAERLGAPQVRVFAGHPEGPVAERWPAMIAALREVADSPGRRGSAGSWRATTTEPSRRRRPTSSGSSVGHPTLRHLLDTGITWTAGPQWSARRPWRPTSTPSSGRSLPMAPSRRSTTRDSWPSCGRRVYGLDLLQYEAAEDEATGIPRALAYLRRLVEGR
jgi:hypothetical protein